MASPVRVQGAEQPLALDHLPHRRHDRGRRFLLHQLRIIDLAGGVIENHDQVSPALILKPLVAAAVGVQQHTRHSPPLAPPAVHASFARLAHQTCALQRQLHLRVAQIEAVLLAELLMKMAHVQVEMLLPIKPQHLFDKRHRHPLLVWLAPPIDQPVVAMLFIPLPLAPHRPVADADDLCRLPPADLLCHRSQITSCTFIAPLHRRPRIRLHAPSHGNILAAR